jgi:hypothetical protein
MDWGMAALIAFGGAGAGGLWMALLRKPAPLWMVALHVAFVLAGIAGLFAVTNSPDADTLLQAALLIYGVAAMLGTYLASFRFGTEAPSALLIWGHGGVAAVASIVLAVALFG